MILYELIDVDHPQNVRGREEMTQEYAAIRNSQLRANGEPYRWVPYQEQFVFGEPSSSEFVPQDHPDADGVQTMKDLQ